MARIDHNVEEFYNRYCNSQDRYKIRPDEFSPYKLTQSHRCSRFCLPCSAHCLNNQNKLSMKISCQLFWNKQYKLVNNYVWETHIAAESEAHQQGPKCPYCLPRCQDHQDPWWQAYPHKTIHLAKCFPIFASKMGYAIKIIQIYFKIQIMMGS